MKFIDAKGNTLDTNNGFAGAVDFSHWFQNKFVMDEVDERNLTVAALTMADLIKKRPKERFDLMKRLKEILSFFS
jgi:hypothetical protein